MKLIKEYWLPPTGKKGGKSKHCGLFQCTYCGTLKDCVFWFGLDRKSCGCMPGAPKHQLRNHPLYRSWCGMRQRCHNPNNPAHYRYGGRGIKICKTWQKNFVSFYKWAVAHGWKQGLTIERKNNNGNYSPRNCTFIPRARQSRNRRPNKLNEALVLEIRECYATGARNCDLARDYGVTQTTMCKIVHNKIWKGVAA